MHFQGGEEKLGYFPS